mmetsp:Transcript_27189/g.82484  ORF Transcript_27189/g.82484 Transcript_27189/m.82484 type:complete len:262 (+) Transcript_27189:1-786(+)
MGCPAGALTNALRTDGFGAQYAALVSVLAWSRLRNRPFCTSPWLEMEHGVNASQMWIFIGGSSLGPAASATSTASGPFHSQLASRRYLDESVIFRVRAAYVSAPKPALKWFPPGFRHVAVHVRRGDICAAGSAQAAQCISGRFTSNGIAARCALLAAERLRADASGASPRPDVMIHIFSEGVSTDFDTLGRIPGYTSHFHLSQPLDVTFHHLVSSHALVMARSTLSDMAGLLSEGLLFAPLNAMGGGQIRYLHNHKQHIGC